MLVLGRKTNERILIDQGRIRITICEIRGDRVRIGVEAPRDIDVHREEIVMRIQELKSRTV